MIVSLACGLHRASAAVCLLDGFTHINNNVLLLSLLFLDCFLIALFFLQCCCNLVILCYNMSVLKKNTKYAMMLTTC